MSSKSRCLPGGVFLTVTAAALGELRDFHPSGVSREVWLSLLYLIVAGSIIAFTAYVWLIHNESPTKVGTYAYVNPLVALLVGHYLGGEAFWPANPFRRLVYFDQRAGNYHDARAKVGGDSRRGEKARSRGTLKPSGLGANLPRVNASRAPNASHGCGLYLQPAQYGCGLYLEPAQ